MASKEMYPLGNQTCKIERTPVHVFEYRPIAGNLSRLQKYNGFVIFDQLAESTWFVYIDFENILLARGSMVTLSFIARSKTQKQIEIYFDWNSVY